MATFTYESIVFKFKSPTANGNFSLLDDGAVLNIAADNDLQLTHSGSVGDITCGTGALDINAGTVNIKDEASSETMASFVSDGAVTLNHDNSARLATSSAGVSVTGTLAVSSTSAFTGAITSNAGVIVDNITIEGTEIDLSSGDLTLDVAGDIKLNADGGDILLEDGTTQFGEFENTSGNLIIKSGSTTAATFSGANVTLAGTVASGAITSSGNITSSGTVSGNGSGLTALNASNISSGTISSARLPGTLGKVLQVVSTNSTTVFSTNSSSYTDVTGMSVAITPSSTSSKVLVLVDYCADTFNNNTIYGLRLTRSGSAIGGGAQGNQVIQLNANSMKAGGFNFLDSPSSTSALTYKLQVSTLTHAGSNNGTIRFNQNQDSSNPNKWASNIIAIEIGA